MLESIIDFLFKLGGTISFWGEIVGYVIGALLSIIMGIQAAKTSEPTAKVV
jgi:hypothetical protein